MRFDRQGDSWEKQLGAGDVENRVMSAAAGLRVAIKELHGDGVLGDTLKLIEASGASGWGPAVCGVALLESGTAYIMGGREGTESRYVNIPHPYAAQTNEVLGTYYAGGPGETTTYKTEYSDLIDDGSFVLTKRNDAIGASVVLSRYSEFTLNATTGMVQVTTAIGAEEQIVASYRYKVPGVIHVEMDQRGGICLVPGATTPGLGSTYTPGATDDPYKQSGYNGKFAYPPVPSAGRIELAHIFYPGPSGKPLRNLEPDESRGIVGLTEAEVASGNYGLIVDARHIITPAADMTNFQKQFADMVVQMQESVDAVTAHLDEDRTETSELDGEGILSGFVPVAGNGARQVTFGAGTAYIRRDMTGRKWLLRISQPEPQSVALDAPSDAEAENRELSHAALFTDTNPTYVLPVQPVTKIVGVLGEVAYRYDSDGSTFEARRISSAFVGGKPGENPDDPTFDANCILMTAGERGKLHAPDADVVAHYGAAEIGQHSCHVFRLAHNYSTDKLHTISIRWDGAGAGGAGLFIWNFVSHQWELIGQCGETITSLQQSLTQSVARYVASSGAVYLCAASLNGSAGVAVSVTTDYVAVALYAGHYMEGSPEAGEPVPVSSYSLQNGSVNFVTGLPRPRNGATFLVQYYSALPRIDTLELGLDGVIHATKGVPSAAPATPPVSTEHVLVAHALVRNDDTLVSPATATDADSILYDDREYVWTGDEGQAAREGSATLLQSIHERTRELHGNVIAGGMAIEASPDANGSSVIYIKPGVYYFDGARGNYAGAHYAYDFGALSAGMHRQDLVCMTPDRSITNLKGTPIQLQYVAPYPELPAGYIRLGYVGMTEALVASCRVPQSAINVQQSQPSGQVVVVSDDLITYDLELGSDGLLESDTTVAQYPQPSRAIHLNVGETGIAYISGQRVDLKAMPDDSRRAELVPPDAVASQWESNQAFHPYIALPQATEEENYFNAWSHMSPVVSPRLQSVSRIVCDALCDYTFRRPHGSEQTHRAWYLSYNTLAVNPAILPAAAQEFAPEGTDVNGVPVLEDGHASYENLMFSDGVAATTNASTALGYYAQHLFAFRHVNNGGTVAAIHFHWEGSGHKPTSESVVAYGARLQVWKQTTWVDLSDYVSGNLGNDTHMALEGTVSTELAKYLSGDGNIHVRVFCPITSDGIRSAQISTDFVQVTVNETNRVMVGNKVFNGDFEYGLGLPYGWDILSGEACVGWDSSEAQTAQNQHIWWKDWGWAALLSPDESEMDAGFDQEQRSKCLTINNAGGDAVLVRQRFALDQDPNDAEAKRPVRLQFSYQRNIASANTDESFAVRLRLWDKDNNKEHEHTLILDVGSGGWQEVTYDYDPVENLSYGDLLITMSKQGTAKFDNFRVIELPAAAYAAGTPRTFHPHYVEHDYEVGLDRIDWRGSGFDPQSDKPYSVTYRHWPARRDSCQIAAGNSFQVFTGPEGDTEQVPAIQQQRIEVARVHTRGDRWIVDEDDGYNGYIENANPVLFTGDEGLAQRDRLQGLEAAVGPSYTAAVHWGLVPARVSITKVTVGAGSYHCSGLDLDLNEITDAGKPSAVDPGEFFLAATVCAGAPALQWSPVTSGWPTAKVVILKAVYDPVSGTFGPVTDLRHTNLAPPAAEAIGPVLESVLSDRYVADEYDYALAALPPAPLLNPVTAGNHKLRLSWVAVPAAVAYRLYRSSSRLGANGDGSYGDPIASVDAQTTTYTDTGLPNGVDCWYKVAAVDSRGRETDLKLLLDASTNAYHQPANGAPTAIAQPIPPAGLSASGATGAVDLQWLPSTQDEIGDSINPACQYALYRSCVEDGGGATGPWQRVNVQLITETSTIDTAVNSGSTYCYYVAAVREPGVESEKSNVATATISAVAPGTLNRPLSPETVTVQRGALLDTEADWAAMTASTHAAVIAPAAQGDLTFVPPAMTPLSEVFAYHQPLAFMPDDASVAVTRIMASTQVALDGQSPADLYGYPVGGLNLYHPYDEMIPFAAAGPVVTDDIPYDAVNGVAVDHESIGPYAHTHSVQQVNQNDSISFYTRYAPFIAGSLKLYLDGVERTTVNGVTENPSTGLVTLNLGAQETMNVADVTVSYQTLLMSNFELRYSPAALLYLRVLATGQVLHSGDYRIDGRRVYLKEAVTSAVRVVYRVHLSTLGSVAQITSQAPGQLGIGMSSEHGWQLDLSWTASDNGSLTIADGNTAAAATYVLDSRRAAAVWEGAEFLFTLPQGASIQFRYRAADTGEDLTAVAWSESHDLAATVALSGTGRYLEVEFSLAGALRPIIHRAAFRTEDTLVSWSAVTHTENGPPLEPTAYNIYAKTATSDWALVHSVSGQATSHSYAALGAAWFYVTAVGEAETPESRPSAIKGNLWPYAEPGPPLASYTVDERGIVLTWAPPTTRADGKTAFTPAGYQVYLLSAGGWSSLTDGLITSALYVDADFDSSASYVYGITAVDDSGVESLPARVSVQTPEIRVFDEDSRFWSNGMALMLFHPANLNGTTYPYRTYGYNQYGTQGVIVENVPISTVTGYRSGWTTTYIDNQASSGSVAESRVNVARSLNDGSERRALVYFDPSRLGTWGTWWIDTYNHTGQQSWAERPQYYPGDGNTAHFETGAVVSARLKYKIESMTPAEAEIRVNVYAIQQPWNVMVASWDYAPTDLELIGTVTLQPGAQYLEVDVTQTMKDWICRRQNGYGFVFAIASDQAEASLWLHAYPQDWSSPDQSVYPRLALRTIGVSEPPSPESFTGEVASSQLAPPYNGPAAHLVFQCDAIEHQWVRMYSLWTCGSPTGEYAELASAGFQYARNGKITFPSVPIPDATTYYRIRAIDGLGVVGRESAPVKVICGSVSIPVTNDTYIESANPATAHGSPSPQTLKVGWQSGAYAALLGFSLTSVPVGAMVTEAKLALNATSGVTWSRVGVRSILTPWDKATASWEDCPLVAATIEATATLDNSLHGVADITHLIARARLGLCDCYGIAVVSEDATYDLGHGLPPPVPYGGTGVLELGSSTNSNPAKRAIMTVKYLYVAADTGFQARALEAPSGFRTEATTTAATHIGYVIDLPSFGDIIKPAALPAPPPAGARVLTQAEYVRLAQSDGQDCAVQPRGTPYTPVMFFKFDVAATFGWDAAPDSGGHSEYGASSPVVSVVARDRMSGLRRLTFTWIGNCTQKAGVAGLVRLMLWDHVERAWRYIRRGAPSFNDTARGTAFVDVRFGEYDLQRFIGPDNSVWAAVVPLRTRPSGEYALNTNYVQLRIEKDMRLFAGRAELDKTVAMQWYICYSTGAVIPATNTPPTVAMYREPPGVYCYLTGNGVAQVLETNTDYAKVSITESGSLHWISFGV